MAQYTFNVLDNSITLYLQYYINVRNCEQLKLNTERFECAFIDPSGLISITQLLQATNRALFNEYLNRSKTGSIYSDTLYFLSPSSDISEALCHYSISSTTSHLLIATFNIESLETIKSAVEGELTPISTLSSSLNLQKVQKLFSLSPGTSSIPNTIYSLLAIKDY